MTDEEFETFSEVVAFSGRPSDLHPLKLDRWWRVVIGAPQLIYLQMGFHTIFDQVDKGSLAIKTIMDLMGRSNLPVSHQEIGQRHIGQFSFYIPKGCDGTSLFSLSWDKSAALWVLECTTETLLLKVPSLESAVEKALEWHSKAESEG